jgi:hypothetical protein
MLVGMCWSLMVGGWGGENCEGRPKAALPLLEELNLLTIINVAIKFIMAFGLYCKGPWQ